MKHIFSLFTICLLVSSASLCSGNDEAPKVGISETFTNTLGMKFVSVPGTKVLFCEHETRVQDYAAFVKEKHQSRMEWKGYEHEGVRQGAEHPVLMVTYYDAENFCLWLSKKEQKIYRLPTDHEWSLAVKIGDQEDPLANPEEKSKKVIGVYPWGTGYPPPEGAGNYSSSETARAFNIPSIENYDDRYAFTSPVKTYKSNKFGIYDLGGNVWEWCGSWYSDKEDRRVLRGGAWDRNLELALLSSVRAGIPPSVNSDRIGFRCVVDADAGAYEKSVKVKVAMDRKAKEAEEDAKKEQLAEEHAMWEKAEVERTPGGGKPYPITMKWLKTKKLLIVNDEIRLNWTVECTTPAGVAVEYTVKVGEMKLGSGKLHMFSSAVPFMRSHAYPFKAEQLSVSGEIEVTITYSFGGSLGERFEDNMEFRKVFLIQRPIEGGKVPFKSFTNTLGMKFVPVPGTNVLFCENETRVQDYAAFVRENPQSRMEWKNYEYEGFKQGPNHPVVMVTCYDAEKFCAWLSRKEGKMYRLPTDHEWNAAVGVGDQEDISTRLGWREGEKIEGPFPWGGAYPPPEGAGNYSSSETARAFNLPSIENYDDRYAFTSPVKTYKPNKFDIYDLGGNVLEWCGRRPSYGEHRRVARGGSWRDTKSELRSSYRQVAHPTSRGSNGGFRCVVEGEAAN